MGQSRDVEQVVHQPHDVLDVPREDGALGREDLPPAELHDVERGDDRRERVSELVAERGEKLVLLPVGVARGRIEPRPLDGLGGVPGEDLQERPLLVAELQRAGVVVREPAYASALRKERKAGQRRLPPSREGAERVGVAPLHVGARLDPHRSAAPDGVEDRHAHRRRDRDVGEVFGTRTPDPDGAYEAHGGPVLREEPEPTAAGCGRREAHVDDRLGDLGERDGQRQRPRERVQALEPRRAFAVARERIDPEPVRGVERLRAERSVGAAGEPQEDDPRRQHAGVADEAPSVLAAKRERDVPVRPVQPLRQTVGIERIAGEQRPLEGGDARPQRVGGRRVRREDLAGRRRDEERLAKMPEHLDEGLELATARRVSRHSYQVVDLGRAINPG